MSLKCYRLCKAQLLMGYGIEGLHGLNGKSFANRLKARTLLSWWLLVNSERFPLKKRRETLVTGEQISREC